MSEAEARWRWPGALVWLVWACFVARAMMYCAVLPLWEGFDEYSHFALIQHMALEAKVPPPNAHISREVVEWMQRVPVPWVVRDEAHGLLSYDAYWQLPAAERERRVDESRRIPHELGREPSEGQLYIYEAQQPPLYYWLMTPVYWMARDLDVPTRVWILRCLAALLASLVIPAAFFAARRVFTQERLALGVCVTVACLPQLLLSACRIGNEGLAIGAGAVAVVVTLRCLASPPNIREGVLLGIALGAALLTKAYFLALIPPAALVLILVCLRGSRNAAARQVLAAVAVCGVIAGWWYARTLLLTGSLSGEQNDVAAQRSAVSLAEAAVRLNWWRAFDFLATSHIWLGNWSFLVVRSWMYRIVEAIALLGFTGAVVQFVRPRAGLPRRDQVSLLALLWLVPVAGLCYHALAGFRAVGTTSSLGYYLYAFVVPELILVLTGLARLLPERMALWPIPFVAIAGLVLEWFGTWLLLLPYYGGLIRHNAWGGLPIFPVRSYDFGVVRTLVSRIVVNKSPWESEWLVYLLFVLCAVAMALPAAISMVVAGQDRVQRQ